MSYPSFLELDLASQIILSLLIIIAILRVLGLDPIKFLFQTVLLVIGVLSVWQHFDLMLEAWVHYGNGKEDFAEYALSIYEKKYNLFILMIGWLMIGVLAIKELSERLLPPHRVHKIRFRLKSLWSKIRLKTAS